MGPIGHTAVSGGVAGIVLATTGSTPAAGLTLAVGVLLDLDHLYDFYQWYVRRRADKIHILLHAWEYSIMGLVVLGWFFYHPLVLAVVVAQLSHVATDHLRNRLSLFGYSITYRVIKGFDAGNHRAESQRGRFLQGVARSLALWTSIGAAVPEKDRAVVPR